VSLNIKNEETHRLARELAERTGESVTAAVTAAVREKLQRIGRIEKGALAERLLALGEDCANRLPKKARALDHGKLLYDEKGLPK
jgi:antitoxin VapB